MEQKIAKNIKTNPKAFWQYAQSKLKTKAWIPDLIKPGTEENPSFIKTDEEKADVFYQTISAGSSQQNRAQETCHSWRTGISKNYSSILI